MHATTRFRANWLQNGSERNPLEASHVFDCEVANDERAALVEPKDFLEFSKKEARVDERRKGHASTERQRRSPRSDSERIEPLSRLCESPTVKRLSVAR